MQLMMEYTFSVNRTLAKIRAGHYSNIRLFYGPMNFDYATNRTDIWVINADQAGDPVGNRNQLSTGGWRYVLFWRSLSLASLSRSDHLATHRGVPRVLGD